MQMLFRNSIKFILALLVNGSICFGQDLHSSGILYIDDFEQDSFYMTDSSKSKIDGYLKKMYKTIDSLDLNWDITFTICIYLEEKEHYKDPNINILRANALALYLNSAHKVPLEKFRITYSNDISRGKAGFVTLAAIINKNYRLKKWW